MPKQQNQEDWRILGDEKGPAECVEDAPSTISPESFRDAFRSFPPVQDLIVPRGTLDGFFRIANQFLRHRSAMRAIKKRKLLADYRRCKRLIATTPSKLEKLQQSFVKLSRKVASRTGPVARFIGEEIVTLKETLGCRLLETDRNIDANVSLLKYIEVQAQERQFTLELERFISHKFPDLKKREEKGDKEATEKINALIGAARAGAGLYTRDELRDEVSLLDRIPMLRYRAKEYSEKVDWEAEHDDDFRWAEKKQKRGRGRKNS